MAKSKAKAKFTHVALRLDSQSPYRAGIRDDKGEVVRVMTFEPNVAVEVTPDEVSQFAHAIGPALVVCKATDSGPEFDWEATREFQAEHSGTAMQDPVSKPVSVEPPNPTPNEGSSAPVEPPAEPKASPESSK